jgi:hypothetical protein
MCKNGKYNKTENCYYFNNKNMAVFREYTVSAELE